MRGSPPKSTPTTDRPTIYDVARRSRLSPATVSKVLRGVTTVSSENTRRVTDAVSALGYRRDPLAANLRRNRRALIGLIVPDFKNPFFGALVAAIEGLAEASGYRLVAVSTSENIEREISQVEALLDWRVGGLILVPCTDELESAGRVRSESVPAVVLDRVPKASPFDGIGVNNADACGAMVRHFYGLGHRQLFVAATTPKFQNMAERLDGIRHSVASLPEPMDIEIMFCGTDLESASRSMAVRFAQGPLPKAVFTLFNQGTLAALREIGVRNLDIPRDISIAGFDDFEWMQVMHPPVATVIQPVEELATRAFYRLIERIEQPGMPPVLEELTCALEFRGSIGAPRPDIIRQQNSRSQSAIRALAGLSSKDRKQRAKT